MGLDSLRKLREAEAERKQGFDRTPTERLKLKPNEKVEVVFLEELEATADTHTVREWAVNGNGQFRSLLDSTESEGSCYAEDVRQQLRTMASELSEEDRKAFYQKYSAKVGWKVYFSVVKVDDPSKVYFFAQSPTSSLVETLMEDIEEEGGITGVVYRIGKGPAASDSWTIRRTKTVAPEITVEPYKIDDLVIKKALVDQPGFLAPVVPPIESKVTTASKPVVSDEAW